MGKLYPDDLGEKVVTRTDIDYVIMIKEKKENWYKFFDYKFEIQILQPVSNFCSILYLIDFELGLALGTMDAKVY